MTMRRAHLADVAGEGAVAVEGVVLLPLRLLQRRHALVRLLLRQRQPSASSCKTAAVEQAGWWRAPPPQHAEPPHHSMHQRKKSSTCEAEQARRVVRHLRRCHERVHARYRGLVADEAQAAEMGLHNPQRGEPRYDYVVTDIPLRFQTIGSRFLGREFKHVEQVRW